MFNQASDLNTPELLSGISVLVPLIGDQYESLTETDISAICVFHPYTSLLQREVKMLVKTKTIYTS